MITRSRYSRIRMRVMMLSLSWMTVLRLSVCRRHIATIVCITISMIVCITISMIVIPIGLNHITVTGLKLTRIMVARPTILTRITPIIHMVRSFRSLSLILFPRFF